MVELRSQSSRSNCCFSFGFVPSTCLRWIRSAVLLVGGRFKSLGYNYHVVASVYNHMNTLSFDHIDNDDKMYELSLKIEPRVASQGNVPTQPNQACGSVAAHHVSDCMPTRRFSFSINEQRERCTQSRGT